MTLTNWENITNYIESVGTTDKTISFANAQESVKVTNKGNANLTYTIGSQTSTLTPGQSVEIKETVSSITIRSASGLQPFEVWGVEKGTEKIEPETDFAAQLAEKVKSLPAFIKSELEHPSKPVKIKVLGSSSVAGQGGTGYSATGESIGSTGYKANEAGYCWVNQLKKYIETTYNGIREFSVDNPFFKIENEDVSSVQTSYPRFQQNSSCRFKLIRRIYGKDVKITIPFYGDSFKFYYIKGFSVPDMRIKIGDNSYNVVGYAGTTSYGNVFQVTGLGAGYHEAVITRVPTPNLVEPSRVCIESFEFTKQAIVKNWAVSGTDTAWLLSNKETLIQSDDTIIWNQMGANDRSVYPIEGFKQMQRAFISYVKSLNKPLILSSSQAVSNTNEYTAGRLFHANDMDTAFRELAAHEKDIYFASNYDALVKYLQRNPGVSISTILVDDQHPNDTGYKIIFEYLMEQLEIPVLKREDTTLG